MIAMNQTKRLTKHLFKTSIKAFKISNFLISSKLPLFHHCGFPLILQVMLSHWFATYRGIFITHMYVNKPWFRRRVRCTKQISTFTLGLCAECQLYRVSLELINSTNTSTSTSPWLLIAKCQSGGATHQKQITKKVPFTKLLAVFHVHLKTVYINGTIFSNRMRSLNFWAIPKKLRN